MRRDGFYLRTLTISLQLTDPSFLAVTQGQECLSQNGNVTGFLGQTDYYTSISAMEPTVPGYCHRLLSLLPQPSLLSSTTRLDTSNTIKRSPSFPLSLGAVKAHHTQGKPETWCGLRSSEKEGLCQLLHLVMSKTITQEWEGDSGFPQKKYHLRSLREHTVSFYSSVHKKGPFVLELKACVTTFSLRKCLLRVWGSKKAVPSCVCFSRTCSGESRESREG